MALAFLITVWVMLKLQNIFWILAIIAILLLFLLGILKGNLNSRIYIASLVVILWGGFAAALYLALNEFVLGWNYFIRGALAIVIGFALSFYLGGALITRLEKVLQESYRPNLLRYAGLFFVLLTLSFGLINIGIQLPKSGFAVNVRTDELLQFAASDVPLLVQEPASGTGPHPVPFIKSTYTAVPPSINGMLTSSEWPDAAWATSFKYTVRDVEKTGEIRGYFMNDTENLYAAITLQARDINESVLGKEGMFLVVDWHFDVGNDGLVKIGEDIKRFWHFKYMDCHLGGSGGPSSQESQHGKGIAGYESNINRYTYEFQAPLNSGEPQDLLAQPGDILGVKVMISQYKEVEANKRWNRLALTGWPTTYDWMDASTFAKLALATKPASGITQ